MVSLQDLLRFHIQFTDTHKLCDTITMFIIINPFIHNYNFMNLKLCIVIIIRNIVMRIYDTSIYIYI